MTTSAVAARDRLRVLLIDDDPSWAYAPFDVISHQFEGRKGSPLPSDLAQRYRSTNKLLPGIWDDEGTGDPRFAECFELWLLDRAEDGKKYRDLSLAVEQEDPASLGALGVLPDIILIDYDLSTRTTGAYDLPEVWAAISPLPLLRLAATSGVPPEEDASPMPANPGRELDRRGCYIGGLIAATFALHPCVPYPTTSKNNDHVGYDGQFFEWLLNDQFLDVWRERGGGKPRMVPVLRKAVTNLRRRLSDLIRSGAVLVSPDDLLALSEGKVDESFVLRTRSRYGPKRYPIRALFLDVDADQISQHASSWAVALLAIALGESGKSANDDYKDAKNLAKQVWETYQSTDFLERHRLSHLSHLASLNELTPEEEAKLASLREHFHVRDDGNGERCHERVCTVDSAGCSGRAKRWASLFLMVRLSQFAADAARKWQAIKGTLTASPAISAGEIRRNDIFLALFPCPAEPITISGVTLTEQWQGGVLDKLGKADKRIDSNGNNRDQCIKVTDVMKGHPWDSGVRPKQWGLKAGERRLLQMYAFDRGFEDRSKWPWSSKFGKLGDE